MRKGTLIWIIAIGFASGLAGAFTFTSVAPRTVLVSALNPTDPPSGGIYQEVNNSTRQGIADNFVKASQVATPCVVFIKTVSNQQQQAMDPFFDFWSNMDFFGRRGPVTSSGSGVIITADGYIVTNLHVVKDADQIEVITNNNKHAYKAKIIGTDQSTDLALLKIEGKGLQHIVFGNSDQLQIGEWVVAVGNPFNLTSTVTAGIVSAKGRNINIVNSRFPIESFIQTDAAINPGNSGGALVNTNGELVGINTAIASNTGSYNGYGFAIPVNIVQKIVKDLIEFKEVQRGFTGMDVIDIEAKLADKLNITNNLGVYVQQVLSEGPSDEAGIKAGDVVIKVNENPIESKAMFDEQISYHRPGDKVKITLWTNGGQKDVYIKLINREGNTSIMRKNTVESTTLGADFQPLSKVELDKYKLTSGIKISNIKNGRIRSMSIPEEFIVTAFNRKPVTTAQELIANLESARGQIIIEGIYPNGSRGFFSFYAY
ncbi:MAG: trypsin-like peptidase domain-containing protein [Bacteroidia bacterium]|jgi:Do/DeqQ family serine protease|nr:trypsin-like peptidase domain-containing protein [Bacteroidia bacterium]